MAGLRVETDLSDPETVALIAKVISEFDENEPMNEGAAMFSSRFADFERKDRDSDRFGGGARVRQKATKRVKESYHLERAKREKEEELKRKEREMLKAQSDELKKQFAALEQESLEIKAKLAA